MITLSDMGSLRRQNMLQIITELYHVWCTSKFVYLKVLLGIILNVLFPVTQQYRVDVYQRSKPNFKWRSYIKIIMIYKNSIAMTSQHSTQCCEVIALLLLKVTIFPLFNLWRHSFIAVARSLLLFFLFLLRVVCGCRWYYWHHASLMLYKCALHRSSNICIKQFSDQMVSISNSFFKAVVMIFDQFY